MTFDRGKTGWSRFSRGAAALAALASAAGYAAAVLSALVLATMVGLVFTNIVLRNLVGSGLDFTGELAGYGVAAMTWGGLAWALREGAVIRISLIGGLLRTRPRADAMLHGFSLLVTLTLAVLAARYFWLSVARHWQRGTVSPTTAEVPMWIPEVVMLVGLLLVILQVSAMLACLLSGNAEGAGETLGSRAEKSDNAEG